MQTFITEPTDVWTRPGPTWMAGTEARSVTDQTIDTFSSTYTFTETNSDHTVSRGWTNWTTSASSREIDGTGSSSTYVSTLFRTGRDMTNYTGSNTTANTTETTSNRTEKSRHITTNSGDTSTNYSFVESESRTNGAVTWSTESSSITTFTNTGLGYSTGIGSSIGNVGNSTATTTQTQLNGWSLGGTSTSSYSTTRSTTGTPSTVSTSRWTIAGTVSTFATSQITSARTISTITYSADIRTNGVSATLTNTTGSGTSTGTITYTSVTETPTVTTTGHDLSPLQDTVVMLNASRNATDYNLGNQLWRFSISGVATNTTTAGLFTDLFSSASAATQTLSGYQKFSTASVAITAITISHNTIVITTSAESYTSQTGTHTTQTTSNPSQSGSETIRGTYKNGTLWNETETSNTVTASHTFDIGEVSTTLSTYEVGDPATVISETIFTGTIQVTGYTSSGWTSATTTQAFGESSYTSTRLAIYSSNSTTAEKYSRKSTTEETLYSSYSSIGTSWQFVGLAKTTTTRVFESLVPTTKSVWELANHTSVSNYTTISEATYSGGGQTSGLSVSEIASYTNYTSDWLTPEIWSEFVTGRNNAWHLGPAHGYGGVGGTFVASSMPVYLQVTASLMSGGTFATSQTFGTINLPTCLAYDGVTIFPDRTDYPISIPDGAIRASYISRVSSLGGAASVGVTWTATTTTTGTGTVTTSTAATYAVDGATSITGSFYRELGMTFNTSDARGGIGGQGGYALGDNAIGSSYTVRINGGHAAWTACSSDSSVSTGSTSSTAPVSFTIPATLGIVVSCEPVFSMSWAPGNGGDHFSSSVPHFPTL